MDGDFLLASHDGDQWQPHNAGFARIERADLHDQLFASGGLKSFGQAGFDRYVVATPVPGLLTVIV